MSTGAISTAAPFHQPIALAPAEIDELARHS
jgi:hypothetical protein